MRLFYLGWPIATDSVCAIRGGDFAHSVGEIGRADGVDSTDTGRRIGGRESRSIVCGIASRETPDIVWEIADSICKISNHATSGACDDFRLGGPLPTAVVALRPTARRRGGWGRAGDSQRAPAPPASDLAASPFGRQPQPPLSCDLRLNHAQDASGLVRSNDPLDKLFRLESGEGRTREGRLFR